MIVAEREGASQRMRAQSLECEMCLLTGVGKLGLRVPAFIDVAFAQHNTLDDRDVWWRVAIMFWRGVLLTSLILLMGVAAQSPDEGYSREQLQPLTKFRCTWQA